MINADNDTIITEFVPKDLFDLHLQNIREKASHDEKFNDARIHALEKSINERFDTFQALMEKNLAEYRIITNDSKSQIKTLDDKVENTKILLSEKIEHVVDTLTVAISNNTQAINELRDDMKHQQATLLAKVGILVAVIVGAVQLIFPMFVK